MKKKSETRYRFNVDVVCKNAKVAEDMACDMLIYLDTKRKGIISSCVGTHPMEKLK